MNTICTCGIKFRDAEDWRDHMPCPGSELEILQEQLRQLTFDCGEMGDQYALLEMENDRLKQEIEKLNGYLMEANEHTVTPYHDDFYFDRECSTCRIYDCPGAPRFKGICPQKSSKSFECHCGCMTVGRENYGTCLHLPRVGK